MSEIGQQIIDTVRAIAKEHPSMVYVPGTGRPPAYVRDGKPSCLVGQALWKLGLIGPDFELDKENNAGGVYEATDRLGLKLDRDELIWLELVQDSQDYQTKWLLAVDFADRKAISVWEGEGGAVV